MLNAFRAALGAENVIEDDVRLDAASTATFPTDQRVEAIIRPADRAQVQECTRLANEFCVHLYPVSRGKNWGLGSRVPPKDGCVLLDLSRLDRIVDHDETHGQLTLQPGVTFRQGHDYLRARGSRWYLPSIGGSPDASVVGNVVERGDRVSPHLDRITGTCALEVVLPTSECIHTGFGRFQDTPLARLHPWGVGPYLDGLFSQSNFGIVTCLTLKLGLRPHTLVAVRFSVADADMVAPVVDRLRELLAEGVIAGSTAGLWNSVKVLARIGRFPWRLVDDRRRANVDESPATAFRALVAGDAWYGSCGIYAASTIIASVLTDHVVAALRPLTSSLRTRVVRKNEAPDLSESAGGPGSPSLDSMYWRKRTPPPLDWDPDRDRCGVHWLTIAVPCQGEAAARALRLCTGRIEASGFEPNLAFTAISPSVLHLYVALMYDRDVSGEDARAMNCQEQLMGELIAAGFLPYRLGIQSMDVLPESSDHTTMLLRRLKQALDPADVLAPRRYVPEE